MNVNRKSLLNLAGTPEKVGSTNTCALLAQDEKAVYWSDFVKIYRMVKP